MESLIIGRIYNFNGRLYRIFRAGGVQNYSGRGCTQSTATPYNYLKASDAREATLKQVNEFLEEEMLSGMAQTINKKRT